MKYVTLIAQPDFNGVPKVLFKSVTDDDHLDLTPKMRLVDAVDARANNRGDLVFELRSRHDREFVIYRIAGGQAEQVFTTGSSLIPATAGRQQLDSLSCEVASQTIRGRLGLSYTSRSGPESRRWAVWWYPNRRPTL